MTVTIQLAALGLLGCAVALRGSAPARHLLTGALLAVLGSASARVALGLPAISSPGASAFLSLPASSRGIDAGLVAAGLLLGLAEAVQLWTRRCLAAAITATVGLCLLGLGALGLLRAGVGAVMLGTVLISLTLAWSLLRLGRTSHWRDLVMSARSLLTGGPASVPRTGGPWFIAELLFTLAVVAAPSATLILLAVAALAVVAHVRARREGITGVVPLLPLLVVPLVLVELHYLRVIAGPVGLATAHLTEVPISPAAAAIFAPPLLLAGMALVSPVVLRRWLPLSAGVLGGVALVVRVCHPLFGAALPGWETLFMPVGVLMLGTSALTGDRAGFVAMTAWTATLVVAPGAETGAWLLGGTAAIAVCSWRAPVPRWLPVPLLAPGAVGVALAVHALLTHQVVYALLALLAGLVLVAGEPVPAAVIYSGGSHETDAQAGAADVPYSSSASL